MGSSSSSPAQPAPPTVQKPAPVSFNEPWRKINWGDKENEMKLLDLFSPQKGNLKLRILLHGPAGSGKSSFINSVDSVCQNRITNLAEANNGGESFTVMYKTHQIKKDNPNMYHPFVFIDIMGLQETGGVSEDDIKLAMKGHVKDGYKFNPVSALDPSDQFYNQTPDENDKVHVLVCVVPANTVSLMKVEIIRKMGNIRKAARDLGIPQIAILTNIDEACPLVKGNIQNVYKSIYIKKMMEELSAVLGIPMNCIYPVKNYHEEQDLDDDIDMLILRALKQMINFAKDKVHAD